MKQKKNLISLDSSGNFTTKANSKVTIDTKLEIIGTNTELPVTIIADFSNMPQHLHSQYLQVLQYQYHKDINVYANIEQVAKGEVKPKWYERLFNLR